LGIFAYILQNPVSAPKSNENRVLIIHNLTPQFGVDFERSIMLAPIQNREDWNQYYLTALKQLNNFLSFGEEPKSDEELTAAAQNIAEYAQKIFVSIDALIKAGVLEHPRKSQGQTLDAVIAKIVPYCEPGNQANPNFYGLLSELQSDPKTACLLKANLGVPESMTRLAQLIEEGLHAGGTSSATASYAMQPQ
jgi:hypothetical protein